jgi:methylmalonyl-CoA mutase N-terminal domain/subunit
LEAAAKGDSPLMPIFIECAEAQVTLGEICGRLRAVWGQYQPPTFI